MTEKIVTKGKLGQGRSIVGEMVTPVVAAAGRGQVPEGHPKVLAELASGAPMIKVLLDSIYDSGMHGVIVILNPDNVNEVRPYLPNDARVFIQETRTGTAPAVKLALKHIKSPHVMTFFADTALWLPQTLLDFAKKHIFSGKKMTIGTIEKEKWDEYSDWHYGRVAIDGDGNHLGIFEHYDDLPEETETIKINPSLFCFKRETLTNAIRSIEQFTAKGEKTINSTINYYLENGGVAEVSLVAEEAIGVNTVEQLKKAREIYENRQMLAVAS